MEGFEKKRDDLFSLEQQEKVGELLNIVKPIFDSFLLPDANSNDAFEISERIDNLELSLKRQGLNPNDYFLWSLLSPENLITEFEHPQFDTEDGQIESFIRSLKNINEEDIAA